MFLPWLRAGAVAVIAVGLALAGGCGGGGGRKATAPSPSATPTASPTPSPSASASSAPYRSGITMFAPTQPLGSGTVGAYVTRDVAGNPVEIGVRISAAALNGLPTSAPMPTPIVLNFPAQMSAGLFDHVEVFWQPQGHEPVPLFGKPHFDVHFYMVDRDSVAAIDPANPGFQARAENLPAPRYMPRDYVTPPGTVMSNTVPGMGLHWLDSTADLVPGRYEFTHILINGSYDGLYTFVEPMVTRDWLAGRNSVTAPVKQPAAFQRSGWYPTTYSVRYDAASDSYLVALGGMTHRDAS